MGFSCNARKYIDTGGTNTRGVSFVNTIKGEYKGGRKKHAERILDFFEVAIYRDQGPLEVYREKSRAYSKKYFNVELSEKFFQKEFQRLTFETQKSRVRYAEKEASFKNLDWVHPKTPRIFIPVSINGIELQFLMDTGATSTVLFSPLPPEVTVERSNISANTYGVHQERISHELVKINEMTLGSTMIENHTALLEDNSTRDIFYKNGISGLLGFSSIKALKGIRFNVEDNRVVSISTFNPRNQNIDPINRNMLVFWGDLKVRVGIGDSVYACTFDTGAPRSHISQSLFETHKSKLGLEAIQGRHLNRRTAKRSYLIKARAKNKYIVELPVQTGGKNFNLYSIEINKDDDLRDDCIIGLDAILEMGGGEIDFVNYDFRL